MTGCWQELDHTADLAIEVYGSDLESLFITSAHALFSLAFASSSETTSIKISVNLEAPDVEILLVDWLNELLYLSEKHNAFFTEITFHRLTAKSLAASIEAHQLCLPKQYIKAATFHNIAVQQSGDGFHTQIVFDI